MFDNPNKELQSLEDRLLAVEAETLVHPAPAAELDTFENDDEFQRIYAEVLAEFGPGSSDHDEPPIRNYANGYGKSIHSSVQEPVEEFLPEPAAPREHCGFLAFLFCLECLVFAGVAAFWLVNQL